MVQATQASSAAVTSRASDPVSALRSDSGVAADQAPPVHKDLQIDTFLQFADQITGRKIAYRVPEQEGATEELNQIWAKYWSAGGGAKNETPDRD